MAGDGMDTGQDAGESMLVAVCREVRSGRREPSAFDAAFARATVFAPRREDRPGVLASNIPGQGRWVLVFSSHERLVRQVGDVPWLSLLPQPGGRARFGGGTRPAPASSQLSPDSD